MHRPTEPHPPTSVGFGTVQTCPCWNEATRNLQRGCFPSAAANSVTV